MREIVHKGLSQPYFDACVRFIVKHRKRAKYREYHYVKKMTEKAYADYKKHLRKWESWQIHYNLYMYLTSLEIYKGWKRRLNKLETEKYGT